MQLNDTKTVVEIIQGIVVTISIAAGGIWAYYQYIKGRLFSPKIEVELGNVIIKKVSGKSIAAIEIVLKNIGTVRLMPKDCFVEVVGCSIKDDAVLSEAIFKSENLFPRISPLNYWYIEPGEIDYRTTKFVIPKKYALLSLNVIVSYNSNSSTLRTIDIDLLNN